jgi:hypothetical protein
VRLNRRLVAVALVALATSGMAQTVRKWRTPGGALYFGDSPPVGSTEIGEVDESPIPKDKPARSSKAREPDPERNEKAAAYSACSAAVTQSLSVPGTVAPPGSSKFTGGSDQFRIDGYVDVTSAGGESIRFRYRCEVARKLGEWKVQRWVFE